MRVLLFTGKGGVGKTSLAAATAFDAAAHGHRVLLLSTDPAHSVSDVLGQRLGSDPTPVAPGVTAREVGVLSELERSWSEIHRWLCALLGDSADPLVVEEVLALPGLEELLALRALREADDADAYDLCVVDCAPTGATLRLLRVPDALRWFMEHFFERERRALRWVRPLADQLGAGRFVAPDEVFAAVERLYAEIQDVREILLDTDRTTARLVVNPARVVVDETRRTFAYLGLYGVASDAVLVNRVLPDAAGDGYLAGWLARQRQELARIERDLPLPLFRAALQPREPLGVEALARLGRALYAGRDPTARFVDAPPIRLERRADHTVLAVSLPGIDGEDVAVAVHGDDLLLDVRDAQRRIALPASLAGRRVTSARLEKGALEIAFAP